ncbi:CHAP domain-containing protein [Nocardioides KLBMP 9356]|uniref:CHAP domain-containing protein n=1 Tax=Nocardioides potassii TaxID=2911371 RepID=A0ABS9HF57_9ACTN|nr:CHAP domain-containing protein [Nocardioides potassii]MCF6378859.1 CHAP domain-containing protein [Nocardioides potassii]
MGFDVRRRLLARALAAACLAGGLVGLSAAAASADDDYPWAWQGQCPIVPQEPIVEPTPAPTPSPAPSPSPGPGTGPAAPDDEAPVVEPPPPPPPVFDPVTGHTYDPRGPRPTCARRVWSINGTIGDSWGFVLRNCTSFAAWRLRERNGIDFGNDFGGHHWGDARKWDDVARRLGYRVDSVPAIGAIAQTDDGRVGHVAWVSAIGPGTVTVEEYNHAVPGGYGVRTVPVGDFRYLHLDDVAPSPFIGSDRQVVSVPDGLGESWTVRVDRTGTLLLSRPGAPARAIGPRRAFSTLAAPALTLSGKGLPWVAATTHDGRVLAGTPRDGRLVLRRTGTSAPTASPAITLSRTGRPLLAATSPDGTLTVRRLTLHNGWSRPDRVGRAGSWATHVAPVLARDASGDTLLVAVGRAGATFAQPLERGRLQRLPGAPGSVTSTPAVTATGGGTTYVHQVDADGRLLVRTLAGRHWSRPAVIAGDWSPYASPAVGMLAGRLHVAAVDRSGAVLVRAAVPGERSRVPGRVGAGDLTRSPGLVTRRNAGVFVVAGRRTTPTLLTRPASAVVDSSLPTRAGFTP